MFFASHFFTETSNLKISNCVACYKINAFSTDPKYVAGEENNFEDCFNSFHLVSTEKLPPSPPTIVQFVSSSDSDDFPPLQPIPRYSIPDLQNHHTSQSTLSQEDFSLSVTSSLSSASLGSYNYQQDDDEWSSGESSDCSSNLSFISDVESAQKSDTSSLDQRTNNSSLPTHQTPSKPHAFNDCFQSQEVETVNNNRHVSSPHIEANVNKFSAKKVFFKRSDSGKRNDLSNCQPSVDINQLGEIPYSANCQITDHSMGFMERLYNQGKFYVLHRIRLRLLVICCKIHLQINCFRDTVKCCIL